MALDSIANIGSGLDDAAISGLRFGADQAQRQFTNRLTQAKFDADEAERPFTRTFAMLNAQNEIEKRENERLGFDARDRENASKERIDTAKGLRERLLAFEGSVTPDDFAKAMVAFDAGDVAGAATLMQGARERAAKANISEKTRIAGGEASARGNANLKIEKKKADMVMRGEQLKSSLAPEQMAAIDPSALEDTIIVRDPPHGNSPEQDRTRNAVKLAQGILFRSATDSKGRLDVTKPGVGELQAAIMTNDPDIIAAAIAQYQRLNAQAKEEKKKAANGLLGQ